MIIAKRLPGKFTRVDLGGMLEVRPCCASSVSFKSSISSCLAQVSAEVLKVCSKGSLPVNRVPAVIADRCSFVDGTS